MEPLETVFRNAETSRAVLDPVLEGLGQELLHYARSVTGSEARADDAFQDLLVALLELGPRVREVRKPRSWLFTVLRRKALAHLPESPRDGARKIAACVEGDPAARLMLEEALAALRVRDQEVVLLHAHEGLTFEEISEVLGLPLGTTLSCYHRSVKRLRELLDDSETNLSSGDLSHARLV